MRNPDVLREKLHMDCLILKTDYESKAWGLLEPTRNVAWTSRFRRFPVTTFMTMTPGNGSSLRYRSNCSQEICSIESSNDQEVLSSSVYLYR